LGRPWETKKTTKGNTFFTNGNLELGTPFFFKGGNHFGNKGFLRGTLIKPKRGENGFFWGTGGMWVLNQRDRLWGKKIFQNFFLFNFFPGMNLV